MIRRRHGGMVRMTDQTDPISAATASAPATVVWSEELLGYDLGDHPLDPVRLDLTMALARELGVLDRPGVRVEAPRPATDEQLHWVHSPEYVAAVKSAAEGMLSRSVTLTY